MKAALLNGRLTVEELVDRYKIRHAGVRHLLIAYPERRKPELDYSTLDNLSRHLASNFWATIEQLVPGQPDLRINGELYHGGVSRSPLWLPGVFVRSVSVTDSYAWTIVKSAEVYVAANESTMSARMRAVIEPTGWSESDHWQRGRPRSQDAPEDVS